MACEGARELFTKYAGKDDSMSKDEFKKMLDEIVSNPEMRAKIVDSDCFRAIDRNSDGGISFPEFEKFCQFMAKVKQMMQMGGL